MIAWLKPEGFFLFYAMTSFMGFLFVYCCVGETMGLSEIDKKFLYQPGGKFGRKPQGGFNEAMRNSIEMAEQEERVDSLGENN